MEISAQHLLAFIKDCITTLVLAFLGMIFVPAIIVYAVCVKIFDLFRS